MQRYNGQLVNQFANVINGNAAAGALVTVKLKSTGATVTLYAEDDLGGATLANPLTADAKGYYGFYAPDGVYTLDVSISGTPQLEIQLQDAAALQAQFDAALANAGYIPVGTFAAGCTVSQSNGVVSDGTSFWRWDGALPKTVTAGSEPTPTGVGNWILVSDGGLRDELADANSTVLVAGVQAKAFRAIDGVKNLMPVENVMLNVASFYAGGDIGGGDFMYVPTAPKSDHNGGTVIAHEALIAWDGTQADIATLLNWTGTGSGCFVRTGIDRNDVLSSWFGASGGEAAGIDHLCVQAALDSVGNTVATGGIVRMEAGIKTRFAGQVNIVENQTLDFNNTLCAISSSVVTALHVGGTVGAASLTYNSKVLNFYLSCEGNNNIAIRLYGTCNAKLVGTIEGNATAANRALGVWVDAGNVSSFFNWIEVRSSHIYESFRIASSGTNFATNQLFINCTAFGDKLYGNTTSIGFNFGADNGRPEGQGSVISGGNVEQCGTAGVYISEFAGPVNVQCRFEGGTNTKDIWFKGSSPTPNTVVGAALHNIVVWDSPSTAQTIFVSDAGVTGVPGGVRKYVGQTEFSQSQTFIKSTDDGAGTGYIALQSGIGSASTGAGFAAYSAAHASFPGDFVATTSGSGVFGVGVGVFGGGGRIFKVSNTEVTAARDNTTKCGSASERFTEVFAANGTINTSDARDKTAVRPFTAQELEASKLIAKEFGFFKWLDAVAEKGDAARSHCGTTVQRIIEIMESCGLAASDYGFICYDEWEALEEIRETVQVDVDEDGLPVMQEVVTRPARPAGNRYSLRDGELMKFIAKGFDARLAELEK